MARVVAAVSEMTGEGSSDDNDDEAGEDEVIVIEQPRMPAAAGFSDFARGKTVSGTLLRIDPVPSERMQQVRAYVEDGAMVRDFTYARELYGLVNPSKRRDFSFFWESPWAEEHAVDLERRNRIDAQQKGLAFRSYVKASSAQDADNADEYIKSVSKVMDWADQSDPSEVVKTISRMVQGFEKRVVRDLMLNKYIITAQLPYAEGHITRLIKIGIECAAHTLRRSPHCYDAFAAVVAHEIIRSEATNGTKNTSIHMSKVISAEYSKRVNVLLGLLQGIESEAALPADKVGLPLMYMRHNLCIRDDLLVVGAGDTGATYILSLDGPSSQLEGVETIKVKGIFTEKDERKYAEATAQNEQRAKRRRLNPNARQQSVALPHAAAADVRLQDLVA